MLKQKKLDFFLCAKDGVPERFLLFFFVQECFVYMYLQMNIHKQPLQTSECVFCERFLTPPPLHLTTQQ